MIFRLRRAFELGFPIPLSKVFLEVRGEFSVREDRDATSKRVVRTATFRPVDSGEPVPPLRDATLLAWNGTTMSLTGVEEIADEKLQRAQRFAQTWLLEPDAFTELERVERLFARACGRLAQLGVHVRMLPDGRMEIPGEVSRN